MEEGIRKLIGERVLNLRSEAGLSQSGLGMIVGIGQTLVSQIERGERRIPPERLEAMADALGTTTSYLDGRAEHDEDYVASEEAASRWRDMVLLDKALDDEAKLVLLALATPQLLNRRSWMVVTTIERFCEVTGRSDEFTHRAWPKALSSPYVEREGDVEWALSLTFP